MTGNLLRFFEGHWTFERTIRITSSNLTYATASGRAVFEKGVNGNELLYQEEGDLFTTDLQLTNSFFRNYRYGFTENYINLYFADKITGNTEFYQSYLYDQSKAKLLTEEYYVCGNDCYKSEYKFINDNCFSSTTLIRGSKKDYTIETLFFKQIPL